MPLVGQMPMSPASEDKMAPRAQQNFTDRARETMENAIDTVKSTISAATEPITHAKEHEAIERAECESEAVEALSEQHQAALHNPNMHDKTKIHMMMDAKHQEYYVTEKPTKRLCEHSHATANNTMTAIKQAIMGKSAKEVERAALMEQHKAALANPSACDKTKFEWL